MNKKYSHHSSWQNKKMEDGSFKKDKKYFEEQIQNFECPFTWHMDCLNQTSTLDNRTHDDAEFIPLMKLMRIIIKIYIEAREEISNEHQLLEQLEKCDEIMIHLKNSGDPEISYGAVRHVFLATKCFVLLHLGLERKLEMILKEMKDATSFASRRDKSTLLGCMAIGWSKHHRVSSQQAEPFIRRAIKENPNCHLWYFILGKTLRRVRRDNNFHSKPTREEIESFEKAYDMSQNPVYGIFLAQMYREQKWFSQAIKMYNRVFQSKPESITLLLRMALGFIRLNECRKAKQCLDEVAKENSTDSMYQHYMGIYYIKVNDTQKAISYLKAASKDNNLPAELQYIKIMVKSDPRFDVTNYLLCMLDRYNNLPKKSIQSLILELAFSYWNKENNLTKAVEYFLEGIEIDPKAECIKKHFSEISPVYNGANVLNLLKKQFLPQVFRASKIDETTIEKVDRIRKCCDENYKDDIDAAQEALSRMKFY